MRFNQQFPGDFGFPPHDCGISDGGEWHHPRMCDLFCAVNPFCGASELPRRRGCVSRSLPTSRPLPFGRETRAHWCVPWRLVIVRTLKTKLGVSSGDWPPLRGRDGHLSPTWYAVVQMFTLEDLGRSFSRENTYALSLPGQPEKVRTLRTKPNVSWRRLATTSRTLGHPKFFSPVTFEFQRLTEDTRCNG